MIKKDYEAFARILRRESPHGVAGPGSAQRITLQLARLFAADNPRFDADRFFEAAGFAGILNEECI